MKYCQHCGTELDDNTKFCSKCGKNTTEEVKNQTQNKSESNQGAKEDIVKTLSERLQINGIIWIVIGALQILIGGVAILPIAVGAWNIYCGYNDYKNSQRILENPTGIVSTYEPLTNCIITLVCNLVLGAVIGVVGSIYHLICVRQFVVENKDKFLELENN